MLMKPADFPRFYRDLGPEAFDRANARAVEAAEPSCDALELVGVSDRSTSDEIHWYGDCVNQYRTRISESQLR